MRLRSLFSALILIGLGFAAGLWMNADMLSGLMETSETGGSSNEREILYWVAPMDPNYRRDGPGKSPMGMDLIPVYRESDDSSDDTVRVDSQVAQNLGIRTTRAKFGPLPRRIETFGYVSFDEDTLHHVHTRVEGWIMNLTTHAAGDPVQKGQTLFELYSPTLVNAQMEYVAALTRGATELTRASEARLMALGMWEEEIQTLKKTRKPLERIRVFAASDGVISHLGVREGIYVTPATHALSIAKLDPVWVLADVFEKQADWVAVGQTAHIQIEALPGRTFTGEVHYIYPELERTTRTLKVRIPLPNPDGVLRPNMYAHVTIISSSTEPTVHIPREALLRRERGSRVVLDVGGGKFRSQFVVPGIESGDRVEIREGLEENARIVVSGHFLIDSESNLDTALDRMLPQAEPD